MNRKAKATTAEIHGRLWGARAQDWADFQEATVREVFEAVLRGMELRRQDADVSAAVTIDGYADTEIHGLTRVVARRE